MQLDVGIQVFYFVVLIISVIIHEVAHGYAANALGDPTAKLAGRHKYDARTVASWNGVSKIKIVDAGLCNGVGSNLAGDPNIARLQQIVSKSPAIRNSLAQQGHGPGDVIAVDRQGSTLIVYVA